jgi:hypothetical protein
MHHLSGKSPQNEVKQISSKRALGNRVNLISSSTANKPNLLISSGKFKHLERIDEKISVGKSIADTQPKPMNESAVIFFNFHLKFNLIHSAGLFNLFL